MSNPYREAPPSEYKCPRCSKPLPPVDIAACIDDCGTWVSAQAAAVALAPEEMLEDKLTRWWRVRAPCPICTEQMTLRGLEGALFQGCPDHGFWIDADTVSQTGLARPGLDERVRRMREDADAFRAEQEKAEAGELERERQRELAEEREANEARERGTQRQRAQIAARRARLVEQVNEAIGRGNGATIVDELLRLETMIVGLANRVTDLEQELDG